MRGHLEPFGWRTLSALTATVAIALAAPAYAQTRMFNLPAQDAITGIPEFARQADTQILVPEALVQGKRTNAVQGEYMVNDALAILLAGTGLEIGSNDGRTITLHPLPGKQSQLQPAAPAATTEEIIVTARRREEQIQNVPEAITAFSGDDIRTKRIETATDLQNYVPSLNVATSVTHDSTITIRGMGPTGGFGTVIAGGGTGVVSYFNEAVANISERAMYYDLQNVQVVKGPQGTLFGKNTTGGVVLFTPEKPTNDFDGYVETWLGDYGLAVVTGAVNVPIVDDKLLVRLAGQRYERDGYTIDRGPDFPGKDYDNQDYWTGRASVIFRPIDGIENDTVAYSLYSDQNGPGFVLSALNPTNGFAPLVAPFFAQQQAAGVRSTALSADQIDKRYEYGLIDTLKWSITDAVQFKDIFSYQVQKWRNAEDLDASPLIITDLVGTSSGWHIETSTFTEEPQLQGTLLNGDLQWQGGGYFEFGHNNGTQPYQVDAALGRFEVLQPFAPNYERSQGAYAQATYDIGGVVNDLRGLKFTAGYRYTWDSYGDGLSLYSPDAGNACFTGPGVYSQKTNYCLFYGSGSNSGRSWTLGLDYQLDPDTLIYVRSGRGYIPGGFNPAIAYVPGGSNTPQYRFAPESDTDVELGTKANFTLGGAKTQIDADLFHTDFTNIQRVVFELVNYNGLGLPSNFTTNASAAEIEGFEFQGTILPLDGLKLEASYSYDFGHYTRIDPLAAPSLVGIPFANLPKHKITLGVSYLLPLAPEVGDVSLSGTFSYQAKYFDAPAVQPLDDIASYSLLNLRIDWDGIFRSPVDASFFVTNATDTVYRVGEYGTFATDGRVISLYGEPRMFGVQLRYRFGKSG